MRVCTSVSVVSTTALIVILILVRQYPYPDRDSSLHFNTNCYCTCYCTSITLRAPPALSVFMFLRTSSSTSHYFVERRVPVPSSIVYFRPFDLSSLFYHDIFCTPVHQQLYTVFEFQKPSTSRTTRLLYVVS